MWEHRPMRRLVVFLVLVGVGATAFAQADSVRVTGGAVVFELTATLSGEEAVPGPGDPNGSGTVRLRVNVRKQKVCQVMRLRRVPDSSVANIRRGRRGKTGPIVVDLDLSLGRVTRSCTTSVPTEDLRAIVRHPRRFYVNVTSDSYPRSAVRGQVRRPGGGGDGGGTTTTAGTTGGPTTGGT